MGGEIDQWRIHFAGTLTHQVPKTQKEVHRFNNVLSDQGNPHVEKTRVDVLSCVIDTNLHELAG